MSFYDWINAINFIATGYLIKLFIDLCMSMIGFVKRNKMNEKDIYNEMLTLFNERRGIGMISILLFVMAFIWLDKCDIILNYIGIPSWTTGNIGQHIGSCYSLLFFIPAFIVAARYRNDLGAKLFMKLSGMFSFVYMAMLILFVIY